MTLRPALLACAIALVSSSPAAAEQSKAEPPKYRSAQEIVDAAPADAWRTLDPANTLYLELETGRVIIELAPQFAPEHVANIRTLASEHFWDGLSIYRSQDNFVVQFGDPDADDPAKARWNSAGNFFFAVPSDRALAGSSASGSPTCTTKLSCER